MAQVPSVENMLPPIYNHHDSTLLDGYAPSRDDLTRAPNSLVPARADVTLPSFNELFSQYLREPLLSQSPSPSPPSSPTLSSPDTAMAYESPSADLPMPSSTDMDIDGPCPYPAAPVKPSELPLTEASFVSSTEFLHNLGWTATQAIDYALMTDEGFRHELLSKLTVRAAVWRQSLWQTILELSPVVLGKVQAQLRQQMTAAVARLDVPVRPDQTFHDAMRHSIRRLIVASTA
ncbi:hypothetical protein H4R34_001678 [Dimargaris verticillata]|uniref:Uncharacterized protein n=1 Tax=Dimargaris verticillata TaxID=2761393 RepID=A0A9W8B9I5_9FUNG|nr:hypothetical protein H4R34_001678 [Dimargaris verticillata]